MRAAARPRRSDELRGKILVDVSNATTRGPDGAPGGLMHPAGSLAEHLQAALPDTAVVKTLNTMLYTVMTNPRALATPPTAFLSGNAPDAKAVVRELLADLGWPPEWILDLGDVTSARGTEAAHAARAVRRPRPRLRPLRRQHRPVRWLHRRPPRWPAVQEPDCQGDRARGMPRHPCRAPSVYVC